MSSYDSYGSEKDKQGNAGAKILLIILCFPFIIAFAATGFGLLMGAFGLVFGLLVGLYAITFSMIVAGFATLISLFVLIFRGQIALGIFLEGCGMVMLGIGFILLPVAKGFTSFCIKFIQKLAGIFFGFLKRRRA